MDKDKSAEKIPQIPIFLMDEDKNSNIPNG